MEPDDASVARSRKRPLVLVVDDEHDLREVVATTLLDRGLDVIEASDGADALARIEQNMPDLILLDMRMPGMDGWTFVREFRNRYGRRVPITVMTAEEDSKLRADQVGADSYVGKPLDFERLYEVVEDILPES
jgi:CheY-like chemotaxis protein